MTAFPREIIEAAEMDGATPWKILWTIVVPMLMPTLMVLATFFWPTTQVILMNKNYNPFSIRTYPDAITSPFFLTALTLYLPGSGKNTSAKKI